jgi:hypothetical protein
MAKEILNVLSESKTFDGVACSCFVCSPCCPSSTLRNRTIHSSCADLLDTDAFGIEAISIFASS